MLLSKIWVKKQEEGTWEGLMQLNTGLELSSTCGLDEKIWALQSPVAVGVWDSLKSPEGVCWGGDNSEIFSYNSSVKGQKGRGDWEESQVAENQNEPCRQQRKRVWWLTPDAKEQVASAQTRNPSSGCQSVVTTNLWRQRCQWSDETELRKQWAG